MSARRPKPRSAATGSDPVRQFLRERGSPDFVVNGGLEALVRDWRRVADGIARGYSGTIEDYLNDMDTRQILEEALAVAPPDQRETIEPEVRATDERIRGLLVPVDRCLWGEHVAGRRGWTAERNWWYFMRPRAGLPT